MITKSKSSPTKPVETEERYSENSIQPPKAPKAWSRGQYARHPGRTKARKPVQPSARMIQDPWKNAISQKEIRNLQPIKTKPDSKNQPAGYDFNQVLLIISIFWFFLQCVSVGHENSMEKIVSEHTYQFRESFQGAKPFSTS